ncbi:MAG: tetratricopeptide repeat protein, partial [Fulvivirga sp.]|uniref:tetratricopeptide repeat protein n=1 Tax=Fulvivirga sp. TaxID=1931237 RepID=UPI0032F00022
METKRKTPVLDNLTETKKYYDKVLRMAVCIAIFYLQTDQISLAQKYNVSDSLIKVLENDEIEGEARLIILNQIGNQVPEPEQKEKYANLLIEEAKHLKQNRFLFLGYISKGYAQKLLGNHTMALTAYLDAVEIASKTNDSISLGDAYTNIASLYTAQEDYSKSIKYYELVESLYKNMVDSTRMAGFYVNYGYDAYKAEQLYNAEQVLIKAIRFSKGATSRIRAYAKSNLALVLAKTNRLEEAQTQFNEAVEIMEQNRDYYAISDCLIEIGGVYVESGQIGFGVENLESGYQIAREHGLKQQIQNASKHLSEAYRIKGDIEKAFDYQSKYYAYRDSLMSAEKIRELGDLRTEFEVGQK